jgi:aconitate hydratase 2/2-methylisocitrate dehydratase
MLGRIPTMAEYMAQVSVVSGNAKDIYRYMNFDQIPDFREVADTVTV